jgi:glucose-1-phosphate adenylyltransferase
MIADGCIIEGEVENSIIFRNVKVARGAVVKNSIVMQNSVLGENSSLNCIIVDKAVVIRDKRNLSGSENHPFYIGKGTMI